MMTTTSDKRLRQELEYAEDRADRLQSEIEDYRAAENRRAEQRERERKESRRDAMPSNRLYHNEVRDFDDAVQCHIAACENEMGDPQPGDSPELIEMTNRCNGHMREAIAKDQQASAIYDTVMGEGMKQLKAQTAKALRDADLSDWAECLEQDDYSAMAI